MTIVIAHILVYFQAPIGREPDDPPPVGNLNFLGWLLRRDLNCIILPITAWAALL